MLHVSYMQIMDLSMVLGDKHAMSIMHGPCPHQWDTGNETYQL